jgi:hypothetical protein
LFFFPREVDVELAEVPTELGGFEQAELFVVFLILIVLAGILLFSLCLIRVSIFLLGFRRVNLFARLGCGFLCLGIFLLLFSILGILLLQLFSFLEFFRDLLSPQAFDCLDALLDVVLEAAQRLGRVFNFLIFVILCCAFLALGNNMEGEL